MLDDTELPCRLLTRRRLLRLATIFGNGALLVALPGVPATLAAAAFADTGAALIKKAEMLAAAGRYEQAALMYEKAAKAFDQEGKASEHVEALKKSAEMYEKQADQLLHGTTPAPAKEAPTPAPKPVAAGAIPRNTPTKAPQKAPQPPAARMLSLPPLPPRSGYVIGRTVFEDGRPVPEVVVSALGYDGQVNLFPGSTPSLGEAKAQNGQYAIRTLDTFQHRTPVSATVSGVKALATVTYAGHPYSLYMHPIDNKPDTGLGAKNAYLGHSGPGAVRDFVFRIHGVRPGSEEYVGQEVSTSDSVLLQKAFYGGSIWLDISEGDGRNFGSDLGSTFVPGSSIEMTLTPTGPLLDGSAGHVLYRRIPLQKPHFYYYLYNIPLGSYTATARLVGPDATASPLLVQLGRTGPTTKSPSVPVTWTPPKYDTSNQTLGRPLIKLFKP